MNLKSQFSFRRLAILSVMVVAILAPACSSDSADTAERKKVGDQQEVYGQSQPIPAYDWSLPRSMWIQFYDAQNSKATTFSYINPITGGAPLFDCPAVGYALPRDTQLTNPLQKVPDRDSVIAQAEPNGLFTSPNTDATIVFCLNNDGTVAPVYTEQKVTAFPFPVKWERDEDHPDGHWVRVGEDSNIKLTTER